MKILFCTPVPLTKSLGAAKVVVELAEEMREIGWEYDLVSIKDLADRSGQTMCESLHHYLLEYASKYDVVDYDHSFLPYSRSDFAPQTLFVARSVLMAHHFDRISIPAGRSWKSHARRLLWGGMDQSASRKRTQSAHRTVQEADLANVSNEEDKVELIRCGINSEKIAVIPFGISRSRRPLFDSVSSMVPEEPVVAFVGTFDYRKGARELPSIVSSIVKAVPTVCFRFLGTAGMFQSEDEVLAHFPDALRQRIEVIPRFAPEELPSLLASCSVGIFPSYIEGMPFGVLEMLASSVPVIAYDAPGPPMMLPPAYLVPRGDAKAMGHKVSNLLTRPAELQNARVWAHERSQHFSWDQIAHQTNEIYRERWAYKQ